MSFSLCHQWLSQGSAKQFNLPGKNEQCCLPGPLSIASLPKGLSMVVSLATESYKPWSNHLINYVGQDVQKLIDDYPNVTM